MDLFLLTAVGLLAAMGYLLGSFPSGLIAARLRRVDIREHGSGRTGTSNVLRTLGPRMAAGVLLIDVSKGALAVALASFLLDSSTAQVGAALGVVAGHNWPLFSRFRGGRGSTPALGTMLVMVPWVALGGLAVFAVVTLVSRYVSLGSIIGITGAGATLVALAIARVEPWDYGFYGIVGAAIVVLQHRDNIVRLLSGRERRLGKEG